MIYDADANEWMFESSGKRVYAFTETIGLGDDNTRVAYGSDGGIATSDLTKAERLELAAFMLVRWQSFRDEAAR